jgi:hypothetical protein
MAICDKCSKKFNLFGVSENGYSFCSANCRDRARTLLTSLNGVPPAELESYIERSRAGPCAKCGGPGPLDLHQSYRVYSMILLTSWSTHNHFVCRACARNEQLKSLGFSTLLGWWGIPFGLIVTPIQIVRNLTALASGADPSKASQRLQNMLKLNLARRIAAQAAASTSATAQAIS